jgi:acetyl esterase
MATYLDLLNQAFADVASQGQPLYEKSFQDARAVLESIQNFKPASDINAEEIKVPTKVGDVTTVIFRSANAKGTRARSFGPRIRITNQIRRMDGVYLTCKSR